MSFYFVTLIEIILLGYKSLPIYCEYLAFEIPKRLMLLTRLECLLSYKCNTTERVKKKSL